MHDHEEFVAVRETLNVTRVAHCTHGWFRRVLLPFARCMHGGFHRHILMRFTTSLETKLYYTLF
jgi:hypothetical protein